MNHPEWNQELVDTLNGLLHNCRDGEYGFTACARQVESTALQALFERRAEDYQKMAKELRGAIIDMGAEPNDGGTVAGAARRDWVTIRANISRDNDWSVVEECERGEDEALERFREALTRNLPEPFATLIRSQIDEARHAQRLVDDLRPSMAG